MQGEEKTKNVFSWILKLDTDQFSGTPKEVPVLEAWLAPTLFSIARLFPVSGSITLCNVINAAVWSSGLYSLGCALPWLLDNTTMLHDLLSSCLVWRVGYITAASFSISLCCDGLYRIASTCFPICLGRECMTMCPPQRTLSRRVPNHEHAVPH